MINCLYVICAILIASGLLCIRNKYFKKSIDNNVTWFAIFFIIGCMIVEMFKVIINE